MDDYYISQTDTLIASNWESTISIKQFEFEILVFPGHFFKCEIQNYLDIIGLSWRWPVLLRSVFSSRLGDVGGVCGSNPLLPLSPFRSAVTPPPLPPPPLALPHAGDGSCCWWCCCCFWSRVGGCCWWCCCCCCCCCCCWNCGGLA
jgi:hypothetical protein